MKNYKGKVVWITGATSGIGEAIAKEFAKANATLIISSRSKEDLNKTALLCNDLGCPECHTEAFDLSNVESTTQAISNVLAKYPTIDILVNNGGLSQRSLVEETPIELDRYIMEADYFSNIRLTKAVLPAMVAQGQGQILVTSSISGLFGFPMRSAYSAAKHALHGFYETTRAELERKGIKVTIACPGRVKTNVSLRAMTKDSTPHGKMDAGQAGGISAEKCAKKMICALEHNKKEVLVGGKELIMVYIRRFLPCLFYKLASKINPT